MKVPRNPFFLLIGSPPWAELKKDPEQGKYQVGSLFLIRWYGYRLGLIYRIANGASAFTADRETNEKNSPSG